LSTPLQEEIIAMKLSPNPVQKQSGALLHYNLLNGGNITLQITDLYGKTLATVNLGNQNAGSYQYEINPGQLGLTTGCYFVTLSDGKQQSSGKLIVD
jgi:hypothetical protein